MCEPLLQTITYKTGTNPAPVNFMIRNGSHILLVNCFEHKIISFLSFSLHTSFPLLIPQFASSFSSLLAFFLHYFRISPLFRFFFIIFVFSSSFPFFLHYFRFFFINNAFSSLFPFFLYYFRFFFINYAFSSLFPFFLH